MTVKRLVAIGLMVSLTILMSQALLAGASTSMSDTAYPTTTVAIFDDNLPATRTSQPNSASADHAQIQAPADFTAAYTVSVPVVSTAFGLLISDDFSNASSGWVDNIDVSIATIQYTGGEYRILNKTTDSIITVTDADYTFDLFEAYVDIRSSGTITGGYGLAFGFDNETPSSASQNHMFQVYPSTQTWRYIQQDLDTDGVTLLAGGTSTAIHTGTESNKIRVDLTNSALILAVNGTVVHTTTPPTTTNSRLALINIPTTSANHEAYFDNLTIYDR